MEIYLMPVDLLLAIKGSYDPTVIDDTGSFV